MPNGPMKITGLPFDPSLYETEHSVQDEDLKVSVPTPCFCGVCALFLFSPILGSQKSIVDSVQVATPFERSAMQELKT